MKKLLSILYFLILGMGLTLAQHSISGKIVDEQGEPIPGVNILIKGTIQGTISNISGEYSLQVKNPQGTLLYSFIGYKDHQEEIKKRKNIDVILFPEVEVLDEVVAVGYNVVRKKDVTGAVAQVKPADIVKSPVANYDQALAGRVAGVQVSSADGTPGEGLNIVIRGGNSITGDNSPLYVVDGIPLEDFDPGSISSHDIKDFDVLKDASATAIYGSRGANGVIIITTKGGRKDGKTEISVNTSAGIQWIPNRLELMSPYDYVKYEKELAYIKGDTYIESFNEHWIDPELYTEEALAKRGEKATSWQDEIFREAVVQNYNFSLNTGNKTSSIYLSTDYTDQQGTLLNTGYKKMNNNLKFTHRINAKAQLGGHIYYSYIKRNGQNVSGNNRNSIIKDAITFRPVSPMVPDGKDGGIDYDDNPNELRFNPVKTLKNTDRYKRQDVVRGNLFLNYKFTKNLRLKISGNYQIDNQKESVFFKEDTYEGSRGKNLINGKLTNRRYQTLATSNTLTWKKTLNRIHAINALAGFEAQSRQFEYFNAQNTKMPIDIFGTDKLQIGTQPAIPQSNKSKNTMLSYFGSINYSLKDKYLVTANYRADGSSKFRGNNKWGYFPSFALAWRLVEENFVRQLNTFSNLKLRAGYGVTGNNRISDFAAYSLLETNTYSGYVINNQYVPGVYHSNLAYSDLKWETTKQLNVGIDYGFLNNRIAGVIDYYKKNTTDLLLYAEMALSTGYNQVYQNIGEVSNEGLEFSLNTVNIDTPAFKWSTSFNISFNKNKTVALNDGKDYMLTNPNWYFKYNEYQYKTQVGEPVGMFYGLQSDGVYQMDDFIYDNSKSRYILKEGIPDNGAKVAPGSAKFVDRNGDGTINELDRTVIGNPHPIHFGGLTNDFKYKNFDLQIFFQWSYGNEILNANRAVFERPGSTGYNYLASVADRWTPTNPSNNLHGSWFGGSYGAPMEGNMVSDRIVEDGSYIRLKTLSFGYTLGKKALSLLGLNSCRVYIAGQNLHTWTNYSGFDPEVSVGKYGALTPGLDYSAYPMSSTIMGGVQIKF
ncbi:TonB-dependent receptor [Marinilabiliaceae bacterium JC017]|nr:TonB-dependent receptor [Marinilabiliaceae bacterium JC017]